MQPKKQLKVQYIGIFEEVDSFYWPKMHFLKEGQKIRAWVDPPPLFGQCPKENVFFSIEAFPYAFNRWIDGEKGKQVKSGSESRHRIKDSWNIMRQSLEVLTYQQILSTKYPLHRIHYSKVGTAVKIYTICDRLCLCKWTADIDVSNL